MRGFCQQLPESKVFKHTSKIKSKRKNGLQAVRSGEDTEKNLKGWWGGGGKRPRLSSEETKHQSEETVLSFNSCEIQAF